MWAGLAQINGPGSAQGKGWANIGPKWLGRSRPRIFFLLFLGGAGPDQPIRLSHNWPGSNAMLNYLQKREQLLFMFCMQPNGCKSCRRAEEKATGVCGHGRDQEVELMVRAASLRGMVEELAAGGRGSKRRRRKREGLQIGERKVHGGSRWSVDGFLWWS